MSAQHQELFDRIVDLLHGSAHSEFLKNLKGPLVTVSFGQGMPTPRVIDVLTTRAGVSDVLNHGSIATAIRSAIPKILQAYPESVRQIGVNHATGGGVVLTDPAVEVLFGVIETQHKNVQDMLQIVETWKQWDKLIYSVHVFRNGLHHEHLFNQH